MFSFLNTSDFLSAVCVSRPWRAARVKRSAWPQLDTPTLIRALQDDDYDNPSRRRLEIYNVFQLADLMQRSECMEMWRHVTDAKVVVEHSKRQHRTKRETGRHVTEQQLQILQRQFPCLSALTLVDCIASQTATGEFYSAMAERLEVLGLFGCSESMKRQLGLLPSLRVLVLGSVPPAEALMQLHQLEYLHTKLSFDLDAKAALPLAHMIRWLSVHHRLRSLSLQANHWPLIVAPFFRLLLAEEQPQWEPEFATALAVSSAPSETQRPPLDWSRPCALTDLSLDGSTSMRLTGDDKKIFSRLNHLPQLTRLQWYQLQEHDNAEHEGEFQMLPANGPLLPGAQTCLQRLQQVRLQFRDSEFTPRDLARYLSLLDACTQLRVLQLSVQETRHTDIPAAGFQQRLAAWAPHIEEIRFGSEIKLAQDVTATKTAAAAAASSSPSVKLEVRYDPKWTSLAACRQLRVLELSLSNMPAGMMLALSTLPCFHTLALTWTSSAQPSMPANLLSCMLASRSWLTVHLHALFASDSPPCRVNFLQSEFQLRATLGGLVDQLAVLARRMDQLSETTLARCARIRVHAHENDQPDKCFAIKQAQGGRYDRKLWWVEQ